MLVDKDGNPMETEKNLFKNLFKNFEFEGKVINTDFKIIPRVDNGKEIKAEIASCKTQIQNLMKQFEET
jgi:hypothetical protein